MGLIPGLAQWVKDPSLLWLWCRLAVAAPIRARAWEPPYVVSVALKRPKKKKIAFSCSSSFAFLYQFEIIFYL